MSPRPVHNLEELSRDLAPLESFDPRAFIAGGDEQGVCDLVLALALIHSDYRDLVIATALLESHTPPTPAAIRRRNGEWSAMRLHAFRQHATLVHALLDLIAEKRSERAIGSATFQECLRRLDKRARQCWSDLVLVAHHKRRDDPLVESLAFLRDKVSAHYEGKEVARGFKNAFFGELAAANPGDRRYRPYVSRGTSLRGTRFYFADAAVTAYLTSRVGTGEELTNFFRRAMVVLDELNIALALIVQTFIEVRGYSWRTEAEDLAGVSSAPASPAAATSRKGLSRRRPPRRSRKRRGR